MDRKFEIYFKLGFVGYNGVDDNSIRVRITNISIKRINGPLKQTILISLISLGKRYVALITNKFYSRDTTLLSLH